jgi:acetolactate synthase-1/2/3 large subunit
MPTAPVQEPTSVAAGPARMMTTAEATVETLLRHGISTVYGLPGVHNDDLFAAFYNVRDRLRFFHTRHEQTAGYMALGAALATGKPQVCTIVPGPGLLNAGAALLTAYGMNVPLVALVGQIPQSQIDRGHGWLHEIRDQVGMARHFSKFAARIRAPHEAPQIIAEALHQASSGRQGPVVLECAMDIWGKKGAVLIPEGPLPIANPPIDEDAVEFAAKVLGAAKKPMIVLGGGAMDASAEIISLAEILEAPVGTFRRGLGVVPSTHRLNVNLPIAHRLWRDTDAVLAIGTRFFTQQIQWGVDADLKVVRIDIDPEEPDRFRKPTVALVGDAADYCAALLRRMPAHNPVRALRTEEINGHRAWLADRLSHLEPQLSFLKAMRAALPENGVFVDEVTQLGFVSRIAFPVLKPRTYFSPGYQDTLGWGFGTALGVKAAKPDTPVLSIAGDGGFMYQCGDLATAVLHDIAVVTVVFDNSGFGNVRLIQEQRYGGRTMACDLANPDFVKLADAFGVASFRATNGAELQRVLTEALALGKPALIHVPCGRMPSPWDLIMMPKIRG